MYKLLLCLPCKDGSLVQLKLLYDAIPREKESWWIPHFLEENAAGVMELEYDQYKVDTISYRIDCVCVYIDNESGSEDSGPGLMFAGAIGWFPYRNELKTGWEEGTPPWKTFSQMVDRQCSISI